MSYLFMHLGLFAEPTTNQHNNMLSLQAISRFKIASLVPENGQVSYNDLARSTGVDVQMLKRVLRHAMTMRVFQEPTPGMVAHTAASKLLTRPHMDDWMHTASEEMWPVACKVSRHMWHITYDIYPL